MGRQIHVSFNLAIMGNSTIGLGIWASNLSTEGLVCALVARLCDTTVSTLRLFPVLARLKLELVCLPVRQSHPLFEVWSDWLCHNAKERLVLWVCLHVGDIKRGCISWDACEVAAGVGFV